MATTTPNYGWPVPTSTDFVKDGATAIEDLGDAIDATVFGLPSGALTLVSTTTIGTAVASVAVTNAFSATYDNYLILLSGGVSSVTSNLTMILDASTTGYYAGQSLIFYTGTQSIAGNNNAAAWSRVGNGTTSNNHAQIYLTAPFLAKTTGISTSSVAHASGSFGATSVGWHDVASSFTGFTIASTGATMTGGTISVYGYAK
jgi:hypothetical protein